MIKCADRGSAVFIFDMEDYTKEAENQLGETDIHEEVLNDANPIMNTILNTLEKDHTKRNVCTESLNCFIVKGANFARFYLLPKIHKRLSNVTGKSVISDGGCYTENIFSSLDFYLQPFAKKVKSYIKDTNDFLKKLRSISNLPNNILLCARYIVGLYPTIPHDKGLSALRNRLAERDEKDVSTDTLLELAESVLRNNIFSFNEKAKRGTTIETKFTSPYSISFMAELEEKKFNIVDQKPYLWWESINDIFII